MSPTTTADELAPVDAGEPEDVATSERLAPVFPTEADVEEITAELFAKNPELEHVSERARTRAVQEAIAHKAARIKRSHSRQADLAIALAPTFPTEAHVTQLVAAIPALTPEELRSILDAGRDAFTASVEAGEPTYPSAEAPAA